MRMKIIALSVFLCTGAPFVSADIYVNVMAVNGAPVRKETPVKYDLPGDLKAEDILDTAGLQLDYDVNNANYVVSGTVTLDPKESKTFRIRLKDNWKISPEQAEQIKDEINKGFDQIGKFQDPQKSEILKQQLLDQLDNINQQQGAKADTVEKRMAAFRAYRIELQRIRNQALAVDYWRSQPGQSKDKIIRLRIEAQNRVDTKSKTVKWKHFLPSEVKPEDVVEAEGFEYRFDQGKQQPFLFKEDEIPPGQTKAYVIGIRDIWSVPQQDIDYLRKRANAAYEFLKTSKYEQSAKFLFDEANGLLASIETSQAQALAIKDHISAFRTNQRTMDSARTDVENLEKLVAVMREDLEKSKVENVLQKIQSLHGVAGVAKQMFEKKPTPSATWQFMGWGLVVVVFLTVINFLVWMLRSNNKKKEPENLPEQKKPQQTEIKH